MLVDLRAIAGKTPEEVAAVLGPPSSGDPAARSQGRPLVNFAYRADSIRVRYPAGRADWIYVRPVPGRPPLNGDALELVGLEAPGSPTWTSGFVLRWTDVPGFREVAIHSEGDGFVDRIHAYVETVP
jgi:hypothetical protein